MKILNKLPAIYDKICQAMFAIAGFSMFTIFILINYDVIKRTIGFRSSLWTIDYSCYSLIFIVFIAASWVLIKDKHIKVDFLTARLKPIPQAVIIGISSALSSIVSLTLMWYGAKLALWYYEKQYMTSSMLEIPLFLIYLAIPIGSFFLVIQFARNINKQIMVIRTSRGNKLADHKE